MALVTSSSKEAAIIRVAERLGLYALPPYVDTILVSAIFYYTVYAYIGPWFLKTRAPFDYPQLPEKRRLLWDSWTISISQSAINTALAVYLMLFQREVPQTPQERLLGYCPQISSVLAVATGYFCFHIYHEIRDYRVHGKLMVIHAITSLLVISLGFKPQTIFYTRYFLIWELPNLFLNFQRWLDASGRKDSRLRGYNRFALLTSYIGARILLGIFCTYRIAVDMITVYRDPRPVVRHSFLPPIKPTRNTTLACFPQPFGPVCEVTNLNPWLAALQVGSLAILGLQGIYWFTVILVKKGDNNSGYVQTSPIFSAAKKA